MRWFEQHPYAFTLDEAAGYAEEAALHASQRAGEAVREVMERENDAAMRAREARELGRDTVVKVDDGNE
jgi:hypothetical protein